MSHTEISLVKEHLNTWTRRHRIQRALVWTWRGILAGGLLGLILGIVFLFRGQIVANELIALVLAAGFLVMLLAGLLAYTWQFTANQAARYFDRELKLKERVSTALELAALDEHTANELFDRQQANALSAVTQIDIKKEMPVRMDWRELSLIVVLILGVVATLYYGAPLFARATSTRAVQTAIEEEIARIEEIQANIESDESLTDAQQAALTEPLSEALEQLEEAQTLEEALATLSETEQELQSLSDPSASEQLQGLQEAGQQLAEGDTGAALNEFGENLAQSDLEQAAQDLAEIDPGSLSPPELADLSSQLSEAAQALAESNPELAEQLAQAAEALQNGDLEAMREALAEAAETFEATGEEVAISEAAGEAASQLGEGQDAIVEAGGLAGLLAQAGTQVQGPGTSGAGNEEFTEPLEPGSEVGLSPIGQNNQAGDGGETEYEPIYAPEHLGGDDVLGGGLPQDDVEGETLGTTASNPDEAGEDSTVPYVEVLADYEDVYRAALENDEIPLEWREAIRDYFSSLQP
ncbi:MAG: hypothetical protein DWQ07_11920 [Chloroflexi bacterium]|nr:MAG: hypothetical protein DWQ07_11920 [Chloroflexota bacterium]MBL1196066.1 hypothetical protein [Chloroflexota bacterium]NOH13360.1 hypothetical protein [Chloroflexota bacterium]